jgi:hypothetical protein
MTATIAEPVAVVKSSFFARGSGAGRVVCYWRVLHRSQDILDPICDRSHNFHHRHYMGAVEAIEFTTSGALVERFMSEVHESWRLEDEE